MAEQEPLYDFPEPSQTSKFKGLHPRSRGSLRSISVLDRLILTVPVWLQLSINPATALHILQREPPGTFLVRNSRTSQKKVLCVRLADNSEPSFVQQFGIQEENSTFSLETSANNFPDLPRLISFYCVSRDVLPFPLELPAAIARASSHKELESISHMGIEFWSSQLNVRGPRDAAKPRKDSMRKPDSAPAVPPPNVPPPSVPPPSVPPAAPEVQAKSESQPDNQPTPSSKPQPPNEDSSTAALFNEFCPIKTRSPKELNYGSGIGALCFINPLFLQSLNAWSRRRMFKRSLKVRVSTETTTLLSPPLAPPPPPPLMPKTKAKCKGKKQVTKEAMSIEDTASLLQDKTAISLDQKAKTNQTIEEDYTELPSRTKEDIIKVIQETAPLPIVKESVAEDSDYMEPSSVVNPSHSPSNFPYLSPKTQIKKPKFLSPHDSPSNSPSVSPYQSPMPSPKVSIPLSPFTSAMPLTKMNEDAYQVPASILKTDQQMSETKDVVNKNAKELGEKVDELVQKMNISLNDKSSLSSQEGAAPPLLPKTKAKCKGKMQDTKEAKSIVATTSLLPDKNVNSFALKAQTIEEDYAELPVRTQEHIIKVIQETAPPPTVKESVAEDSNYMQPSSVVNPSHSPSNVPYLFPKTQIKKPKPDSSHDFSSNSPSVSSYQSPTPSPKVPIPLSPFTSSMPLTKMNEDAYQVPASFLKIDRQISETNNVVNKNAKELGEKVDELVQKMKISLNDNSSLSSQDGAAPPLMPKTKAKCKGKMQDTKEAKSIVATTSLLPDKNVNSLALKAQTIEDYAKLPSRTQEHIIKVIQETAPPPTVKESLAEDSDYIQPSSVVSPSHSPSNCPYLFPKTQIKKPNPLSPHDSPSNSPSVSPTPSPKVLIPLSPFTSAMPLTQMTEKAYQVPASILKTDQDDKDEAKNSEKLVEKGDNELVQQMNTASLNDKDSSSLSSQEEAEESH